MLQEASMPAPSVFHDDDIKANRSGKLSRAQIGTVRAKRRNEILFLFVVAVVITSYTMNVLAQSNTDPFSNAARYFGILVGGMLLLGAALTWQKHSQDIRDGRVSEITGPIHLKIATGRSTNCSLSIGGQRFAVLPKVILALRDGEPYRVYYAPRSKIFLAAEPYPGVDLPIASDKPKRDQNVRLGDDGELVIQHKQKS
jgi:hypothetical protein